MEEVDSAWVADLNCYADCASGVFGRGVSVPAGLDVCAVTVMVLDYWSIAFGGVGED